MHAPAATDRPARHLASTNGGLEDAQQFWRARRPTDWISGDRYSRSRTSPYPLAVLASGRGFLE